MTAILKSCSYQDKGWLEGTSLVPGEPSNQNTLAHTHTHTHTLKQMAYLPPHTLTATAAVPTGHSITQMSSV